MEQQKILELLEEMSLDEKIHQLFQGNGSFYEGDSIATGPASEQGFSEQTILEAGSVLSIVGAENVKKIQKGQSVSYGGTYTAESERVVATIPIGYADGVARCLSNKIYGLLNGQLVKQVGNITMDQMMFDIGDNDAKAGDIITLLDDKELSLDNWAEILGTINYELTCRLKVRLPRVYVR